MTIDLPPTPAPFEEITTIVDGKLGFEPAFSYEQMRAYAREAARLERKACADLCDAMPDDAMVNIRVACAAAIRARGEA